MVRRGWIPLACLTLCTAASISSVVTPTLESSKANPASVDDWMLQLGLQLRESVNYTGSHVPRHAPPAAKHGADAVSRSPVSRQAHPSYTTAVQCLRSHSIKPLRHRRFHALCEGARVIEHPPRQAPSHFHPVDAVLGVQIDALQQASQQERPQCGRHDDGTAGESSRTVNTI
jgi:hypothetical protein